MGRFRGLAGGAVHVNLPEDESPSGRSTRGLGRLGPGADAFICSQIGRKRYRSGQALSGAGPRGREVVLWYLLRSLLVQDRDEVSRADNSNALILAQPK